MFAQQLNTDGEPHFDKLVGVKFVKPYYPNGENYDFLLNYGPEIQASIKDEKLRNWSPWLD